MLTDTELRRMGVRFGINNGIEFLEEDIVNMQSILKSVRALENDRSRQLDFLENYLETIRETIYDSRKDKNV